MSCELSGQLECPGDSSHGHVRPPGRCPVAHTAQEGILPRMDFRRNGTIEGSRARSTRRNRFAAQKCVTSLKTVAVTNRNPRQCPDPGRFEIARTPNRHSSFGLGVHIRAGNSLGRKEAAIALRKLFGPFSGLQLMASPDIAAHLRFREIRHLHVAVK